MKWALLIGALCLAGCNKPESTYARNSDVKAGDIKSGYAFLQDDTKALQDDDFANPGFLWVDRGKRLFETAETGASTCSTCHGAHGMPLKGVAAHYPKVDAKTGKLLNLEAAINLCREQHQGLEPLAYESDDLLGMTAYVASLPRGEPVSVDITGPAARYYEEGRDYFFRRKGQFNLACSQCHNEHWGEKLRGDTISQGHGNAFPAYRLEWQDFGSLHRRLRDCDAGIRAEPQDYGSETYMAVELYLAKRAEGLAMESPGVRR